MTKKGRVILIRKSIGMFAAETSSGSVTVFELLASEPVTSGDILSGNLDELGIQRVYNETSDAECRVFVHERSLTISEAVERHFPDSATMRRPMWPAHVEVAAVGDCSAKN